MNNAQDLVDLLRPPSGRCLGAAFISYDFDEGFFESVLAALLTIHADPDTDPDRFVDEGRRRLRETPVMVLVDGFRERGGHRLPFDLLTAPPSTALHARLALTLFTDHARLMLGSANLTEGGYGGNAELVGQLVLDYQEQAEMLDEVRKLCVAAGAQGEAWTAIEAQLDILCAKRKRKPPLARIFYGHSVMEQMFAALPKKAHVSSVALLLGTQPEDEAVSETHVLDKLAKLAGKAPIALGLPWEGNPVAPPAEPVTEAMDALLGRLCARIQDASITYMTPLRVHKGNVICRVGQSEQKLSLATLQAEMQATPPSFWPLPELTGVGPVPAIEALLERAHVDFHLFPELRLQQGQVYRRALHAKALAVVTREGKQEHTHLLLGAPNLERLSEAANKVFEAALYQVLPGQLSIESLAHELIAAPVDQLYLQNRPQSIGTPPSPSPLESAVFDSRTRVLVMSFKPGTRPLAVTYQAGENETALIDGEPRLREVINDFALDRHSAELRVEQGEETWLVPIAFLHVGALHCGEPEGELEFWDLVDLRCGRDGTQSAGDLPEDRHAPQRVFAAIASLVDEIARAGSGVGSLRVALESPTGLDRFIDSFLRAAGTTLDKSEAWLYGQELARLLRALPEKKRATERLIDKLEHELDPPKAPYAKSLERFYREA